MKKVVIDVGHSSAEKGAISPHPPYINEWDFNSNLAETVSNYVTSSEVEIIFREPNKFGYRNLPNRINQLAPDAIISLHCNAATPAAFGTEMIYCSGSAKGRQFAEILQQNVSAVFGWEAGERGYRGVKTPIEGRGETLLMETIAPCVICEPFFLSNEDDCRRGIELADELGRAYAESIDQFLVYID